MDKNLLLLFDRPYEPVFVPKGEQKVSFEVPPDYLAEQYQPVAQRILSRFGNESLSSVPIKQIAIPNLSPALKLSRKDTFSLFLPAHRQAARYLTELFLGMRTVEDLLSLAAYCRDRVNPQLFIYAFSVALVHRPDTKHLPIPNLPEVFPNKYVDNSIFTRALEEANVVPTGLRTPIEIPLNWTATDVDPEHRVAYWREDVGINLHHWHWHLVYPYTGAEVAVRKDRRGELFYYFHHQIMSRYNVERLSNKLQRVQPLTNLREPIPEAYFSKMDQGVSGRAYPGRPENQRLSNVNRTVDGLTVDLSQMELWRSRILEAIRTRTVRTTSGQTQQLDDVTGIDILGNMIEASDVLGVNPTFYGDLHNMGHVVLSYTHDPDHRYLESFTPIGDPTTAMRDPVFYKWHEFVDRMFIQFKDSLPPYTQQQLDFPGVFIQDMQLHTPGGNPNTLNTYWTKSDIDLSRGLDFAPRGPILVRIQHLNHDAFMYTFIINNSNNREVTGTVRVFMAPKFDENGRQLSVNEQRLLMIEMDKFTTNLRPGQNIVQRNSNESSVTIPFEATFRNVDQNRPDSNDLTNFDAYNFCGCGWPQHLLVPKGTKEGFAMDLFVMVSNYTNDRINQASPTGCRDGVAFCGLRDLKYPDKQAMGFPFDRAVSQRVSRMTDFLLPNMRLQPITVRFSDTIKPRQINNQQFVVGV